MVIKVFFPQGGGGVKEIPKGRDWTGVCLRE